MLDCSRRLVRSAATPGTRRRRHDGQTAPRKGTRKLALRPYKFVPWFPRLYLIRPASWRALATIEMLVRRKDKWLVEPLREPLTYQKARMSFHRRIGLPNAR
jgi:hypothetical protein